MIRTIQRLKAFGVFADFRWPADLPEFKQFNLIYGWNYSGKTTLSRAFRCFEQKQPHADLVVARGL
jgi:wobble nucleotide-excising tRNase